MKPLQMILVFIVAFSLGAYVTERRTASLMPPSLPLLDGKEQGCKTDLLVVFPFQISQSQLTEVMTALYDHYPEWSAHHDGATVLRVTMHVPHSNVIDEIKLESQAIGGQPALCLTRELRKEIEALAADTLQRTAMKQSP